MGSPIPLTQSAIRSLQKSLIELSATHTPSLLPSTLPLLLRSRLVGVKSRIIRSPRSGSIATGFGVFSAFRVDGVFALHVPLEE